MSISEIQSRVQSIQARLSSPPIKGQFNAMFEAQLAAANARAQATTPSATVEAPEEGFVVGPQASPNSVRGSQAVTLGAMLGITSGPTRIVPSGHVYTAAELQQYMDSNNIQARNGRLSLSELQPVSGAWYGTGHLLPPAASSWEQMRAAAAEDGIELQAIDLYRSWETQDRAYQAHLRGEKKAHVLPPGRSEHGNGLAVDITNGHIIGHGDQEHTWMVNHGRQFGWYPISNETWHWEFRGIGA